MKNSMRKLSLTVILCVLAVCFVSATALIAHAEEPNYYVCFSNQNYAVRNQNKMEAVENEYVLKNVSLSSAVDFYVTDNTGMRWYAKDNAPVKVEETGMLHYDILFSLENTYENGSHITYRFYEPAVYSVTVADAEIELSYNPYHTAYELYYISSIELAKDTVVAYGEETHTVADSGYYRILFTPEKVTDGKTYLFDDNGNYGSGDEYKYSVYIEDAPQYYAVYEEGVTFGGEVQPDAEIKGQPAYAFTREESNVAAAEFRSQEVFAPARDFGIKYRVYEKNPDGAYRLIDDDNNADTEVSKITVRDRGWYVLSVTAGEGNYLSTFRAQEKEFGDWYLAGEFNGFCYDENGNIDLSQEYKFKEIEDGDEDYNADYRQYIVYLTVDEQQVKNDPVEFYITNGKTKFKDGTEYIQIKLAGTYKIICSEEHNYGRGRNFRYVLQDEGKESIELRIGTAEEFTAFAGECAKSAEYSVNLKVYLTADIDFEGVTFVPVGAFSGTFYGGYHKLKNITYSNGANSACVFESLTHTATVERLTAENVNLGEDKAETVGVVGRNYGKVKEVTVSGKVTGKNLVGGIVAVNGSSETETGDSVETVNSAKIESCVNNAEVKGETYVGGIAGRNTGHIASCENTGAVTGSKTRSSATVEAVGGIAGYSLGKIYDCANTANVDAGDSGRYVGGIVGLSVGEIYFSTNRGQVLANQSAGGIVGYYGLRQAENSPLDGIVGGGSTNQQDPVNNINILNYNVNYGDVSASAYVGGIVGNVAALSGSAVGTPRTLKIFNCASVGKMEAAAGSYAGGIAGNAEGVRIKSCFSSGSVQAKGLNAGKYVGGIVGNGGEIAYSMSSATLKGEDYIGGIAGYATSAIKGCYTNVVLLPSDGATNVGGIAGYSANYDNSKNEFTDVLGNYYVGTMGGIGKTEYGASHKYAAGSVTSEVLASVGTLSPVLSEDFSREYWQGGKDVKSYPFLRNFEDVEKCEEFDDEALFAKLFDKHAEMLLNLSGDCAKLTYTVTFMEWNKDNGDLYRDGELQIDNFDVVTAIRVTEGQNVTVPELVFAALNGSGKYVYTGDNARYFVRFPAVENVNENLTVYAEYLEILTSITDGNRVFVEGEFAKGTEVTLTNIGEYSTLKFLLDGVEITVENVTVKYFVGDNAENFTVFDLDGEIVDSLVSGKYLAFDFTSGNYFSVKGAPAKTLPLWAWILIAIGGTAVVIVGGALIIVLIIKKKEAKAKAAANVEVGEDTAVEASEDTSVEENADGTEEEE